ELFDDYTKKLNQAWSDNFKKQKNTDTPLYEYKIITQKLTYGPYANKDPKDFKLQPQKKDLSIVRSLTLKQKTSTNKWIMHVGQEVAINEFIVSTIKQTEEGQELFKNEPVKDKVDQTDTMTNAERYRLSTLFSIEPVIDVKRMDKISGNYT